MRFTPSLTRRSKAAGRSAVSGLAMRKTHLVYGFSGSVTEGVPTMGKIGTWARMAVSVKASVSEPVVPPMIPITLSSAII